MTEDTEYKEQKLHSTRYTIKYLREKIDMMKFDIRVFKERLKYEEEKEESLRREIYEKQD